MIATAAILFTAWWALPPWIKEIPAGLFVSYFLRRKNRNEEYVKGRKSYNRCCKLLQRGKDLALRSEENAPKAGTLLCLIRRYLVILDEIWESVTEKGCKKPGFLEVFAFFALMRQLKDTRANERDRRYQEVCILRIHLNLKMIYILISPFTSYPLLFSERTKLGLDP